jgi:cytochrome P450
MSDQMAPGDTRSPHDLAHPQPLFKLLRDAGPIVDMGGDDSGEETGVDRGNLMERMVIVGRDADVRHVLSHPEVFSSGIDAVHIGQVRPLIPLQIDPPHHRDYRKLLNPIFAPRQVALLEDQTRALVAGLIDPLVDEGRCNFHEQVAEPLPTTVFLQMLGLPVSRAKEFIALKDGIIRPPVRTNEEREAYTAEVGQRIYAVLQEAIDQRTEERSDDLISMFLDAEVDGHRLTNDDVLDIGYLFFLAGLDTVTASLDCMMAYLAQHPEQRRRLVEDPAVIPHAIEEMLRWETPVPGVVRVTTEDTEISGCPIGKGRVVSVMLAAANTDERSWDDVDDVDFDRGENPHIAFGGGIHRCLGSNLARMELRVALEEWHRRIPDYRVPEGHELLYSPSLRSVDNLELVW